MRGSAGRQGVAFRAGAAAGAAVIGMLLVADVRPGAVTRQTPAGYPEDGQPPIVRLVSPGAEPRVALRYRPIAGSTDRMDMRVDMSISMQQGEMAARSVTAPPILMSAEVEVTEVDESGDVSVRMAFVDAGVEDVPGVDSTMLATLQSQLRTSLVGFSMTGSMSSRGLTKSFELDLSRISDPQARQTLSAMSSTLEQLSVPLPEEAVGIGARWEAYARVSYSGLLMFQKGTFTVTAIDDDEVTMDAIVEQQAPYQAVENPALPPEAVMMQSMSGFGTGTTTFDLRSLVPTSVVSVRSNVATDISLGGNRQSMTMEVAMKMSIRRSR